MPSMYLENFLVIHDQRHTAANMPKRNTMGNRNSSRRGDGSTEVLTPASNTMTQKICANPSFFGWVKGGEKLAVAMVN